MAHVRLNEKEPNPNPHINFITPLRMRNAEAEEDARQLLRALAAQVKPVMRAHGFVVNSLEEYEYNTVFAGRNWNNGETVELVLRGPSGRYYSSSWLISVLCHELAHIKHMNHGPGFQALNTKLRKEVRDLQSKGYYGDGYWSSGTRLHDGARVNGQGLDKGSLPEYMCGGAHTRARPTSFRRRRRRQPTAGPSEHTGVQTEKKRKAGSRVSAKNAFKGEGSSLNSGNTGEGGSVIGTGFGKRASSKKAREERALAMERRLKALKQDSVAKSEVREDPSTSSDDEEVVPETDQDRRRYLLESVDKSDLDHMKTSWSELDDDFIFPSPENHSTDPVAGPSRPRALPPRNSATISTSDSHGNKDVDDITVLPSPNHTPTEPPPKRQKLTYGSIVQDEIRERKKEALGMSGPGRALCEASGSRTRDKYPSRQQILLDNSPSSRESRQKSTDNDSRETESREWSCLVCTLSNKPEHLACSACATPRGEATWAG